MLLAAKITKPNYAPGIIDRPRLYRQLDRWQDFRAVVIHAPAGYGKSTLVSRWIDISGLGGRSAWFSLEEEDSSPHQFIQYVAAALDSCLPGLLAAMQPVLKDRQGSMQRALTQLLANLEESSWPAAEAGGQHLLLVLDDLQRVESPEVDTLIHRVLEYGPDHLHLLLLARQRTNLSLARLFAHGAILALNKQDLRFTEKEVLAYLQRQGFPLSSAADVAQITLRSEGWVSGLHLAVLSLRKRGSVPELLRALKGNRDWLADFLADEVLDHQRPELRLFLLQTAILARFNASLCTAITGMGDAKAKLAEIARADLFLIELGSHGGWFRYHNLFQELLQQRLITRMDAGVVADLHHRAAAWLAAEGQIHAALHHLLAAGAEEKAADLVQSHMRKMLVRDLNEAKRLVGLLPQRIWQQRPRLALDRCLLALLLDDPQTLRYVQQAAELLQSQGLAAENAPALYGEWLVLISGAHLIANNLEATASFARQAQPYVDDLDDLSAGILQFVQTHLHYSTGDQTALLQAAERALAVFTRVDFLIGTVAIQRQLARWSMNSGSSQEATRRFHTLLDNPPRDRPEIFHDLVFAYLFAAENSYWQNDLDQAYVYQQASLALARQLQDDLLLHCIRIMGAIYHPESPDTNFQNQPFNSQIEQTSSRILLELLTDLDIRRWIAAGHMENTWAVAQRIGIDRANMSSAYQHRSLIPYLRATIARGLDLPAVTPLLAGALTHHAGLGNRFNQLQLLALTSWQQLKLDEVQTAAAILAKAAHLAQETGYIRVLLDIPELAGLLPETDHNFSHAPPHKSTNSAATELTPREHQILKLLATGQTYQQISDEMIISINTVRTHVRHIYEKLSVNKRVQAIAAARHLGLLND